MKTKSSLPQEIMNLLKKYAEKDKEDFEYINPHFLTGINELLDSYYKLEDYEVDKWIQDMWSA